MKSLFYKMCPCLVSQARAEGEWKNITLKALKSTPKEAVFSPGIANGQKNRTEAGRSAATALLSHLWIQD